MLAQIDSEKDEKDSKKKKEKTEKAKKKFADGSAEFNKTLDKVQSWAKKYKAPEDIPESDLPEVWDLRDMNGYDFTGPVRDQGPCGSCYTVSFTQVVEARLKQKYGLEQPELSAQHLMQCNYMNEGCDGGWSFFHGYLAENGFLVSNECAPYLGKTKGQSCGSYQKC